MQFHEKKIDLFDFTSFFCLDFFNFFGPLWILKLLRHASGFRSVFENTSSVASEIAGFGYPIRHNSSFKLVMVSGTRNPKTRRVNPTFWGTRTRPEPERVIPEPDPKPDIQNPKTRGFFGFQNLG